MRVEGVRVEDVERVVQHRVTDPSDLPRGAHRVADQRRNFRNANICRHRKILPPGNHYRKCNMARHSRHPESYGRARSIRA